MTAATDSPAAVPPTMTNPDPWVLVDTMVEGADRIRSVIAEGLRSLGHSRIGRTRLSRSRSTEQQLGGAVSTAAATRQIRTDTFWLPSGFAKRCVAVPIPGPDRATYAVHLWAGHLGQEPPPRPRVATLSWSPWTGLAKTTKELERLLAAEAPGSLRALPDLMRHLDIHDRAGMMALFGTAIEMSWSGTAVVTAGNAPSRCVQVVAHRKARTEVCAIVHEVTPADLQDPPISLRTLRQLPIDPNHAMGLVDVRTGLVHEWLRLGPHPLDRWVHENPRIGTNDIPSLAQARARLIEGVDEHYSRFGLTFGDDCSVVAEARWRILNRDPAPQAFLDLQLVSDDRARLDTRNES